MDYISVLAAQFANWEFMDEPLYRWFLFGLAMALISWGWSGVLGLMK
jgi:hypothetical protein